MGTTFTVEVPAKAYTTILSESAVMVMNENKYEESKENARSYQSD
jgi:hypothetical protein